MLTNLEKIHPPCTALSHNVFTQSTNATLAVYNKLNIGRWCELTAQEVNISTDLKIMYDLQGRLLFPLRRISRRFC